MAQRILPPEPPVRPPVVWVEAKLKPLTLEVADIDIKVRGHVATTRMELTFANPNGRVIEGELVFPLGEGQSVSGYELEIDGRMRASVAVPKAQAREVFEDIVRRGIDPGLAELTKGNVFRTRLYPILAKGTKRVAVTFEQELTDTGAGYRYVLPLGWKEKIARFQARVEAVKQEDIPLTDEKESEPLTFTKWNDSFTAELKREDFKPGKPLAFTVPKRAETPAVFTTTDALEPGEGWFAARTEPKPPATEALPPATRVALFYDASGSAERRDRAKEFAFLKAWVKASGVTTVDLVVFRNEADALQTITINGGDAAPLIDALKAAPLDGGTSLGAVDAAAVPEATRALLITDGISNFGSAVPRLTRAGGAALPVIAVHAAQAADHALLGHLARQSGGRALNLLTTTPDEAAALAGAGVFRFLGAKVLSGDARDLTPAAPAEVTRGFSLAGRFKGRTELELTFGHAGGSTVTQRLVIDPATALEPERGAFIRRLWAQKRVAELLPEPKRNEAQITQIGTDFGIVTPFTSLLVLERVEDYAEYGIEPAEPELRKAWQKLMGEKKKPRPTDEAREHMESLAKQWKEFRDWHAKRHPWLETVLAPAAKREADIIARLTGKGGSIKDLTEADLKQARAFADAAEALAKRWRKEGADAATRATWEKEAIDLMLNLDALRQKRIAAAPDSDKPNAEEPATAGGAGFGRPRRSMNREESAADPFASPSAPPAAPAPLMAVDSAAPLAEAAKSEGGEERPEGALKAGIEIKPWSPDTPYLKKIRSAEDAYAAYLKERKGNASSTAFYLDCADYFREEKKDARLALRILSNLAEMDYESAPLVRILAARLQQLGRFDLAVPLWEDVLAMRPEEPQSRRDLALAVSRQTPADIGRAAALLWEVASRPWDGRFEGIGIIALHELNAILAACPKDQRPDLKSLAIPPAFLESPATGLRVVLTWDADATDIDLWVTDPAGETVMYSRNRGQTGGHVTNDFTQGYGPEVFTIARPLPGTYTVRVNYYGNRQQKFAGATTVQIEFQTAYGTAAAKQQSITRRLTSEKEVIEVGKFTWKPEAKP